MDENIPSNFDPRFNDAYEFVPYDEDPVIQNGIAPDDQSARDLGQRVRAWQDAMHELGHRPGDEAALHSLRNAEQNLEDYLSQHDIMRTIREKQPPEQ